MQQAMLIENYFGSGAADMDFLDFELAAFILKADGVSRVFGVRSLHLRRRFHFYFPAL